MDENKQENKGCLTEVAVFVILIALGLFFLSRYMKGLATSMSSEEQFLTNRLESLPVIETDDEISKAISGEPKNYLVKNYVFKNSPTIKDTVLNVLNGNYLCVDILEETLTYYRKKVIEPGATPYYSLWREKPYCQISAPLCFNSGVEILKPDSLVFMFSFLRRSKRIFESELNPEKKENFSIDSRYYPERSVKNSDPEKAVQDIFKTFGDNLEELAKRFGDNGIEFDKRYNLTYMTKDDEATFAVRLGNGKADFNVFDSKNIVIVGGDSITGGSQESLYGKIWAIMANVFMVLSVIIALGAIIYLAILLSQR
ncbi:MAG: hypothetical protein IKR41_09505 [Bacteroidales bacterium]|nr:hypothetical protein [Bacteroidales bacterium]